MPVVLGPNRYGKAETRLVRVVRDGDVHHIKDVTVGSALSGDMEAVHLTGDNAAVLPTDTQKNTVYAFARKHGVAQIEDFAILLARHYVDSQPTVHHARVEIEEYFWDRIPVNGDSAPGAGHSFVRSGRETRTCVVHHDRDGTTTVVSGLRDLVVLNSTGSEFSGFAQDEYTTLKPTRDRVLATEVSARWRHLPGVPPHGDSLGDSLADSHYGESYDEVRRCLLGAFAETYSLSLQQTLYAMGERVLNTRKEVCEVRLAMPNKHHFLVDLTPFGLDNPNEVFYAADRPYGLIEGSVLRDDTPDARFAWE
ncbi:factor-independent urate hydroxylase [Streptosporangium sp. NPDC002544]|uniref:factor-independent urate hydroxylase n=1 Tax=Streptosporangium sp. NPDC002544 TaxID=3154538 RepID=UPI00332EB63C